MHAQKETYEEKKKNLELLVSSGAVEPERKKSWLRAILGFLLMEKPDLTHEQWKKLERHPRDTRVDPAPFRDRVDHFRWHI